MECRFDLHAFGVFVEILHVILCECRDCRKKKEGLYHQNPTLILQLDVNQNLYEV